MIEDNAEPDERLRRLQRDLLRYLGPWYAALADLPGPAPTTDSGTGAEEEEKPLPRNDRPAPDAGPKDEHDPAHPAENNEEPI